MLKFFNFVSHATAIIIMLICLASIAGCTLAPPRDPPGATLDTTILLLDDELVVVPYGIQGQYMAADGIVLAFWCHYTHGRYPHLLHIEDHRGLLLVLKDVCLSA